MSCTVRTKSGRYVTDSHNGLLLGLAALCLTEDEHKAWRGSNDLILTEEQLNRGRWVLNFNFPSDATPAVHSLIERGRFDYIAKAALVIGYANGRNIKSLFLS